MKFDIPSPQQDVNEDGFFAREWQTFLTRLRNVSVSRSQYGTTAQRPNTASLGGTLEIGLTFFDTTLNRPIWISQATPTIVWRDATGAIV
jgi:hypothetical protein